MAVILIVSIAITSIGYAAAGQKNSYEKPNTSQKFYRSFELTAEGTAKNADRETVDVSLSIEGNAKGKIKTVLHLHTQSGDATIEGYDDISVVRGQGIVIKNCRFIYLNIMMSSDNYCGRSTLWALKGTITGDLADNTMDVHLRAARVWLPLEDHPKLTNLKLDGTIEFFK